MSDVNCASTIALLNDQFMVQRASINDLPEILNIYNQSINGKQATANLVAVTIDERTTWFAEHLDSLTRPIYVVKVLEATVNNKQTAKPLNNQNTNNNHDELLIVAWGSFSDLYARTAYHISSEISVYLDSTYHGRGLGSLLTRWMLTQAPNLGIRNIVALVFSHNKPSLGLFHKLGFEQWGYMSQVCDMQGFVADVVMLGIAVEPNHTHKL